MTTYTVRLHEAGKKDETLQALTLLEKEQKDNIDALKNEMSLLEAREKAMGPDAALFDQNKPALAEIQTRRQQIQTQINEEMGTHQQLQDQLSRSLGIKPQRSNALYQNPNAGADQGIPAPPGSKDGQSFRNKRTGQLGVVRNGRIVPAPKPAAAKPAGNRRPQPEDITVTPAQ
jgi:hypothetical protein